MRRDTLLPLALFVGIPLWALYASIVRDSTGWSWGGSVFFAARTLALAGVLAWALCPVARRLVRLGPGDPRAIAGHVGAAILLGAAWVVVTEGVETALAGENPLWPWWTADNVAPRVLIGALLYGVMAGGAHAVAARTRAERAVERASRAEAEAVRARLAALRARLDPHLLFNALNTVSSLVHRQPDRAEAAVDRLASLLRRVVDEDRDWVTVREEWRFVVDYLELERIRFGDRVQVNPALAPETLERMIPAFTLQTLVENSIRHGLGESMAGGTVSVTAADCAPGRLRLVVSDDGAGADPETVGEGVGLGGLRRRLETVFGEEASLVVETAPDRGFRATVELPALDEAPVEAVT